MRLGPSTLVQWGRLFSCTYATLEACEGLEHLLKQQFGHRTSADLACTVKTWAVMQAERLSAFAHALGTTLHTHECIKTIKVVIAGSQNEPLKPALLEAKAGSAFVIGLSRISES